MGSEPQTKASRLTCLLLPAVAACVILGRRVLHGQQRSGPARLAQVGRLSPQLLAGAAHTVLLMSGSRQQAHHHAG